MLKICEIGCLVTLLLLLHVSELRKDESKTASFYLFVELCDYNSYFSAEIYICIYVYILVC